MEGLAWKCELAELSPSSLSGNLQLSKSVIPESLDIAMLWAAVTATVLKLVLEVFVHNGFSFISGTHPKWHWVVSHEVI